MMQQSQYVLLVDNSNTRTKFALADANGVLCSERRCLFTARLTPRRVRDMLDGWNFGEAVIGSVAPDAQDALTESHSGHPLHLVSCDDCPQLLRLYDHPACVGADRLANAAAAALYYPLPCMAVDLGTACTLDAVVVRDGDPVLLGGVIAPGLQVINCSLSHAAGLLPALSDADLHASADTIDHLGRTTRDAMLAGVVGGYDGMLCALVQGVKRELGSRACTVVTGGDAARGGHLPSWADVQDDDLTLKGLFALARGFIR